MSGGILRGLRPGEEPIRDDRDLVPHEPARHDNQQVEDASRTQGAQENIGDRGNLWVNLSKILYEEMLPQGISVPDMTDARSTRSLAASAAMFLDSEPPGFDPKVSKITSRMLKAYAKS